MTWIDQSGRLFGKINIFDFGGLALGLLVAGGILLTQSGMYQTSGQVIQGEGDIQYTVYIRNLKTLQPNLFQPGKKLSITIRNQPRGQVEILDVKQTPKRSSFLLPNGSLKTLEDPADPYGYDYLVTLKDHALFSADGYVTEGIKVKIGLGIEVEGHDYRVSGAIVDIRPTNTPAEKPATVPQKPH